MTSFYSKSSSTCYPWLLIFPGHHQKEVGEVRRRGEEQKWFLLPSSIMMWHNHSPGLTHALCLLPGDSQAAVMCMWATSSLADHLLLPSAIDSLQPTLSLCYQCLSLLDSPYLDHEKHPCILLFWKKVMSISKEPLLLYDTKYTGLVSIYVWHLAWPQVREAWLLSWEGRHKARTTEHNSPLDSLERNSFIWCILSNDWRPIVVKPVLQLLLKKSCIANLAVLVSMWVLGVLVHPFGTLIHLKQKLRLISTFIWIEHTQIFKDM